MMIIETYEDRKLRDDAVVLLKLAVFSIEDEKQGKTSSSDEIKQRLIQRLKQ
ncbi:MAG: hypothetical protein ACI8WB_006056 [Phenylobacterium sp.]|jgi:hypothetical protein